MKKTLRKDQINSFQTSLLEFFSTYKRDKPWQKDRNPYTIWLFEVIMQQTRMAQGLPYYEKISRAFPKVQDLANAKEDDLFSLWKGLGYYSRARNLQFTAKYISNELKGVFPITYSELLKLKGVGEYTAAAIASFAFEENIAVLDGNVHRILSRIFGIDKTIQSSLNKKYFQDLANDLLVKGKSSQFNQAMMDLGSTVCKPQNPLCEDCTMSSLCYAYQKDKIVSFPPKKHRPELKVRYFHCIFLESSGEVLIEKRENSDIWKGLYQGLMNENKEIDKKYWKSINIDLSNTIWTEWQSQTLSHQKVFMKFGQIKLKKHLKIEGCKWVKLDSIETVAMPKIISNYWQDRKSNPQVENN